MKQAEHEDDSHQSHLISYDIPETWNGLAVIMDTYDNDGSGQHPMIALHFNDGSKSFEFDTDGATTLLSSCPVPYRNQPSSSLLHLFIEDDVVHVRTPMNPHDRVPLIEIRSLTELVL